MEAQSHWVNNFWGHDDAGYHQLMQRMQNSKQTMDEIKQFYRERLLIEQDYARKLNNLSQKALGSSETGEIKKSLEVLRSTTKVSAATHETVARQLQEQLFAPLDAFGSSMRNRSKTVEDTMNQLTRAKSSQNSSSEKARLKYMEECNKISGLQAQQNLLMGKELDKNNQKLDRASMHVEGLQRQYQESLKALAQTCEIWNSEWRVSCDKLEQIDGERITFMKSSLWAFANCISAACVADDEGCETTRLSLERTDPSQDIREFSTRFGTGSKIQDPPEFVNFLHGFSRDSVGKEGSYHVANYESALDETNIPNLGISESPALSYNSPQSQLSSSNFTPMSSPGTTKITEEPQHQKSIMQSSQLQPVSTKSPRTQQRKSWVMPFKRKNSPENSEFAFKPISAFDKPTPSSSYANLHTDELSSIHNYQQQSPQSSRQQQQISHVDSRRQSWAPATATFSNGNQRSSAGIGIGSTSEDPLLAALEKLKMPVSKPRPKSMALAGMNYTDVPSAATNSINQTPGSPYGNGSRPTHASERNPPPTESFRKSPVNRKQVGSLSLPTATSDGRRVIKHCHAQYDYRAAIPEEVTFKKGDLLLVTEMQEDGWWDCELAGHNEFGLAPSNFLTTV